MSVVPVLYNAEIKKATTRKEYHRQLRSAQDDIIRLERLIEETAYEERYMVSEVVIVKAGFTFRWRERDGMELLYESFPSEPVTPMMFLASDIRNFMSVCSEFLTELYFPQESLFENRTNFLKLRKEFGL